MTVTRTTTMRAALACIVSASVYVPGAADAVSCSAAVKVGAIVERDDHWREVRPPVPGRGPQVIVDAALLPHDGERLAVTNGYEISVSGDGGCSWHTVLDESDYADADGVQGPGEQRVVAVAAGSVDGRLRHYAVLERRILPLLPPDVPALPPAAFKILTTDDGGATWVSAATGLPPIGTVRRLEVAPADGATAYAIIDAPGAGSRLFVTTDAGESWIAPDVVGDRELTHVYVEPNAAGAVWAWGRDGLVRSTDGGSSFVAVPGVRGEVTAVAVSRRGGGDAVMAVGTAEGAVLTASDGATTWETKRVGGSVEALAAWPSGTIAVATDRDEVVILSHRKQDLRRVSPVGHTRLRTLVPIGLENPEIMGEAATSIFVGRLSDKLGVPKPKPRPLRELPRVELNPGAGLAIRSPRLSPRRTSVTLPSGRQQDVRYTLELPPEPTPLDVMFVLDTTSSFDTIIDDIRQRLADIINSLASRRVDVRFGIASFREFPAPYSRWSPTPSRNYAYRLDRAVGRADTELENVLALLRAEDGTTDGRTSALTALKQLADGSGVAVAKLPGGPDDTFIVPPGGAARFRPGSVRVAVLITDIEPRRAQPAYPGPTVDDVVRALVAERVHVMGIEVGKPVNGVPGPRETMATLAKATDALAPREGVDCDRDGETDLEKGEPLVCFAAGSGVVPVLIQLLQGIREEVSVEFRLAGHEAVAVPRSALEYDDVNIKAFNRLSLSVRFRCAGGLDSPTTDVVRLTATVRGRAVGSSTATVLCEPTPQVPQAPEVRVDAPRIHVAAAFAPVPPPPPAPINNLQPLTNPNVQANPQANVQVQGGMAAQDQDEVQLAFAHGTIADDDGELAMSALDGPEGPADARVALFLAAAGALSSAAAAGWRWRVRGAAGGAVVQVHARARPSRRR